MLVYKDEERGTWYVRCYYEDFTGKKKQIKKRGFKLQREAKEWEADFLRKQNGSTDMTFRSMYEIYIEDMGHRCRQSTIDGKKHVFEKLILPYFENKPINKITPNDIRAWQNELIGKKYSNSYLDRIQNMITALFNYAMDYFNLSENPCHKAGRMGKREVVVNFWTKDEFDRILTAMEDDPTAHVSFSLLYYSGIRFGEFLALTPTDFDFEKNTLDINKSLQRVKKQDVITPPKTPKSIRNIIIPDFVMNEVKDYISKLYDIKDTDRVFPFTKSYINNAMARACKKSGVKKIRIHDIRHSHASYLINLGCAPLLISERLGHEKIQTTLNTYSHLYPNKHQEVVDMIQNQHRLDEAGNLPDKTANTTSDNEPDATTFKVVSPNGIISPKQAHEKRGA
jgi:integrase